MRKFLVAFGVVVIGLANAAELPEIDIRLAAIHKVIVLKGSARLIGKGFARVDGAKTAAIGGRFNNKVTIDFVNKPQVNGQPFKSYAAIGANFQSIKEQGISSGDVLRIVGTGSMKRDPKTDAVTISLNAASYDFALK